MNDQMTLSEAREWLRKQVDDGAKCPCCTQFSKVYRRKINAGMASGLITMYRTYGLAWGHVPSTADLSRLGGELARLRMWGLVEESPEPRDDGGRAGWWRVTAAGERFVRGQERVPKYARVYDGRCLGLDGDLVSVRDALGTRFDYDELMATR